MLVFAIHIIICKDNKQFIIDNLQLQLFDFDTTL